MLKKRLKQLLIAWTELEVLSPHLIIYLAKKRSNVWSFACTIFEMITGDFLFEPRKGQNYDKDDDHLAQMMELLGKMPKNLALSGKNSRKFFD